MGEKKRRREAALNGPCPCNSTLSARDCCWNGQGWHRSPADLGLGALPKASSVEKCYMKELGSCVGPISGEHIISEAVIHVLKADGDFSVSGLPWLAPDETKILAPKNLRANCLCSKHNSALHPLDDTAQYFFASLKSYLELGAKFGHALVSGHDLERWLLKTAKNLAVSRSFARGRERLSGAFARDNAIISMLDNPGQWPEGAGLYCVMNTGDRTLNHPRFQCQPMTNERDEIEAMEVNILGLNFVLLVEPPDLSKHPFLSEAKYRPGRLVISHPSSTSWVTMSWDDEREHEHLTLQFEHLVQNRLP